MNEQQQVPAEIAAIIEEKRKALVAEKLQKEENERIKREETEAIGRAKHEEYIQESMLKVPEFLRPYVVTGDDEPDFYRIGVGWDRPNSCLHFQVPGLAEVVFNPNAKESPWKTQSAHPSDVRYWEGEEIHIEPSMTYSDRQYGWVDDVEYALGLARKAAKEFEQYTAEYAAQEEERNKLAAEREQKRARDREEQEARQREAEIQSQLQEKTEKAEEQALFDMIKNDPVAMALLKAFTFIRQERAGFESQIEDANESMYSMENYWSSKASELRRQADDAQRRAEDEKYRLQSDLDDAEAKLKKAERGW